MHFKQLGLKIADLTVFQLMLILLLIFSTSMPAVLLR